MSCCCHVTLVRNARDEQEATTMIIRVDDTLAIQVHFDILDREDGYDDDIRFALIQSGPREMWLFPSDEISFLLTPDQAEQLASALRSAARESRKTPRSWWQDALAARVVSRNDHADRKRVTNGG